MKHFFTSATLLLGTLLGFTPHALALTCPSQLNRTESGRWASAAPPGWETHYPTAPDVTVEPDHFGGAVFSPKQHRMACVYKTSRGNWIALISHASDAFRIDKYAIDESGKHAAWRYNPKYQDYACGLPTVSKRAGCPFQLE